MNSAKKNVYVPPSKRNTPVIQESFDKAFPILIKTKKTNINTTGWSDIAKKLKSEQVTPIVHDKPSYNDIYAHMVFPNSAPVPTKQKLEMKTYYDSDDSYDSYDSYIASDSEYLS